MNAKEAYKILIDSGAPSNNVVCKCIEFRNIFVFNLARANNPNKALLDAMLSVNKETKEVRVFQPFQIPLDDYKSGKEVKDFK